MQISCALFECLTCLVLVAWGLGIHVHLAAQLAVVLPVAAQLMLSTRKRASASPLAAHPSAAIPQLIFAQMELPGLDDLQTMLEGELDAEEPEYVSHPDTVRILFDKQPWPHEQPCMAHMR